MRKIKSFFNFLIFAFLATTLLWLWIIIFGSSYISVLSFSITASIVREFINQYNLKR